MLLLPSSALQRCEAIAYFAVVALEINGDDNDKLMTVQYITVIVKLTYVVNNNNSSAVCRT